MTLTDDFKEALRGVGGKTSSNNRVPQGKIALQICLQLEKRCRFAYVDNELRYYKDGWYQPDGEKFVRKMLQQTLPDISQSVLKETIAKLSQRNYRGLEECDSDPNLLNTEDGFVDMDKMKLLPHNPDYLSITQFPAKFVRMGMRSVFLFYQMRAELVVIFLLFVFPSF